jgi:hypothetical protein
MAESFAERLSRFTPDGSGLDRDALLFAAGQASVRRSNRFWGVLTGTLAGAQLLTVVLLWPAPRTAVGPVADAVPHAEITISESPPAAAEATSLWALNRRVLDSKTGDLPGAASVDRLVAADPPLGVWAAPSQMGLD